MLWLYSVFVHIHKILLSSFEVPTISKNSNSYNTKLNTNCAVQEIFLLMAKHIQENRTCLLHYRINLQNWQKRPKY